MNAHPLMTIGALDGRYRGKLDELAPLVSEFGLLRYRVVVECKWFAQLAAAPQVMELPALSECQAQAIDALLERNPAVPPGEVEDVVVGCASQAGEQGGNLARHAAVLSRLPIEVPGLTISRACSSGLNSIAIAANQIAEGCAEILVAGGVESISGGRRGTPGETEQNPRLLDEKSDIFMAMGNTAEVVARRYEVQRDDQDEYALQSQLRYAQAQKAGLIDEEIAPMHVQWLQVDRETGAEEVVDGVVDRDECNRPTTTLEGLGKLRPAFEEDGTVTAGNASQLSDGASMTLLMSEKRAEQLGSEGSICAGRFWNCGSPSME